MIQVLLMQSVRKHKVSAKYVEVVEYDVDAENQRCQHTKCQDKR